MPADLAICYTPPQLARRWKRKPESIIRMIRDGRLAGFNLAAPGKRPQWRISPEAVQAFEQGQLPQPKQQVNRRPSTPRNIPDYLA